MNMFKKNRKGFTLIELIIVIAILAILAAIAIPMFNGITDSANNAVAQANASNIATAYNAYQALNPNAKIPATATTAAAIQPFLVDQNLWPAGLDAATIAAADSWLNIHDQICELRKTATSASAAPAT